MISPIEPVAPCRLITIAVHEPSCAALSTIRLLRLLCCRARSARSVGGRRGHRCGSRTAPHCVCVAARYPNVQGSGLELALPPCGRRPTGVLSAGAATSDACFMGASTGCIAKSHGAPRSPGMLREAVRPCAKSSALLSPSHGARPLLARNDLLHCATAGALIITEEPTLDRRTCRRSSESWPATHGRW